MSRKLRLSEAGLRTIIRKLIIETYEARGDADNEENLLVEPDDPDSDEEKNEVNTIAGGGIRGVTTPLGTGPTYPVDKDKKKKKKCRGGTDWYKN